MAWGKDGAFSQYIGFWKDGKQHGYGQMTWENGKIDEGVYENGRLTDK